MVTYLFYYHFLVSKPRDPSFWSHQINTPAIDTWEGLAFEQLCLLHIDQIRRSLGISGVLTDVAAFSCRADPENGISDSQIDLVIQRADRINQSGGNEVCQGAVCNNKILMHESAEKSL